MTAQVAPRKVLTELCIGAGICVAGFVFLVDPTRRELQKVRTQVSVIEAQTPTAGPAATLTPEQINTLRAEVSAQIADIKRKSEPAKSEATMFALINELARTHGVKIDQLVPGNTRTISPAPTQPAPAIGAAPVAAAPGAPTPPMPGGAPAPPVAAPVDTMTPYTISAVGSYVQIASFVRAMSTSLGFAAVRSLRLAPKGDEPGLLVVSIESEHYAFDVRSLEKVGTPPTSAVAPQVDLDSNRRNSVPGTTNPPIAGAAQE